MPEEYNPGDEFADDGEFDRVVERTVHSSYIPIFLNDLEFRLTPVNTVVRLFFEGEDGDLGLHSRAIVDMDDGSKASLKTGDDTLRDLVRIGCSMELPTEPDESDREFMDGYAEAGTEMAESYTETGLDQA